MVDLEALQTAMAKAQAEMIAALMVEITSLQDQIFELRNANTSDDERYLMMQDDLTAMQNDHSQFFRQISALEDGIATLQSAQLSQDQDITILQEDDLNLQSAQRQTEVDLQSMREQVDQIADLLDRVSRLEDSK